MISRRVFLKDGAFALVSLGFAPSFLARTAFAEGSPRSKQLIAIFQRGAVDGLNVVVPFGESPDDTTSAHHLAVVVLPEAVSRDAIRETMRERGVQTSVHYPPIHRFSAYADSDAQRPLPQTDAIAERILTLPLFAHMTEAQVDAVTESLFAGLASSMPHARVR